MPFRESASMDQARENDPSFWAPGTAKLADSKLHLSLAIMVFAQTDLLNR